VSRLAGLAKFPFCLQTQANELIKPEQLDKWLSAPTGAKPLVTCVAFPVLYPVGHIAGAKFAWPTAVEPGMISGMNEIPTSRSS
jgi:hypothetical protein